MQPYQQASEELRRQGEAPIRAIGKAATLAAGATTAFGGLSLSKVLPFLNKYVPENLAVKGLDKIDPRFGKFIAKAQKAGASWDEISEFINQKAEESDQKQASEDRNVIEKYSPELHEFIQNEIKRGRSPLEAGAIATMGKKGTEKFKSIIEKIVKEHKAPWSSIIETVYGQGDKAQQPSSDMQSQQIPQSSGNGNQALMQILSKINQRLGG